MILRCLFMGSTRGAKHAGSVGLMAACLVFLAISIAAALDPSELFDDPVKEARARDIGRSLRCMVCQNQSIFDSNAGLAKDLRVLVRERIDAGDSDREVLDYITARFGDYVLLKPPVAMHTFLLWTAPVLFALFGGAFWAAYFRRKSPASEPPLDANAQLAARRLLKGDST